MHLSILVMDFLRQLLQTGQKHLVQIEDKSTEVSVAQPLQSNVNLNELDDMNHKDFSITEVLHSDKNLNTEITQANVTTAENNCNNADKRETIDDLNNLSINEAILNNNNSNDTSVNYRTCDEDINIIKISDFVQVNDSSTCIDPEHTKSDIPTAAINDEPRKTLKDFESAYEEFLDKSVGVNCGHEIIDLNEFQDFLGQDGGDTNPKVDEIEEVFGEIEDLNDSKVQTLENVDVISIVSSTDEAKIQMNSQNQFSISSENVSQPDDYNSSDFEFITEEEANMDGFIININIPSQDLDTSSISSSEPLSNYVDKKEVSPKEVDTQEEFIDPLPGPSGLNKPKHEFEDRSYRNKHVLPEGEQYLDLFRGIYNPLLPVCEIFFLENKSIRASAMNIQYDGIGFDKQLLHKKYKPDSSEDEFEDEAKNCAQKILKMYPGENKKKRRRF
ncbi:unnamed protein product [Chrysodeixis includens]|uniref:Uncharacterized protein n=1 Tax=Chrysodeixis includens TaxID=689277 RepID=A0A9N8Q0B6_CHRIL|nr:unnamed protein product [Chrysodeixis includens]